MVTTEQTFRLMMYHKYPTIQFRKVRGEPKFIISAPLNEDDAAVLNQQKTLLGEYEVTIPVKTSQLAKHYCDDIMPTTLNSYESWLRRNPTVKEQCRHYHSYASAHNLLLRDQAILKPQKYNFNTQITEREWKHMRGYTVVELTNVEKASVVLQKIPWLYDVDTLTYVVALKSTTYMKREHAMRSYIINDTTKTILFCKALFTGTNADIREAIASFIGLNTWPMDATQQQRDELLASVLEVGLQQALEPFSDTGDDFDDFE